MLAANYVMRPLRDDLGVKLGPENLNWSYTGTFLVTAAANPLFSFLVTSFSRRRFIPYAHRGSGLLLLTGFLLLHFGPAWSHDGSRWFLFAWISTFNLLGVSLFWGLMADTFDRERAKRLFGIIAIGATLGAIAGSTAVWQLSKHVHVLTFVAIVIALLEVANVAVRAIAIAAPPAARATTDVATEDLSREEGLRAGGIWGGITETVRSPYLLGICAYLLLMTATSTFTYYEQTRLVNAQLKTPEARQAYFAQTDFCVNAICLIAQALLTGRLVRYLGVGLTAAVLPLVTAAGFVALSNIDAGALLLSVLFWFQVSRRAAEYAVSRPAREVFFTIVPRDQKYKAKSFIDTFIYRGGDLVAVWAYTYYRGSFGAGLSQTAVLVGGICAVWVVLCVVLGGRLRAAAPAR